MRKSVEPPDQLPDLQTSNGLESQEPLSPWDEGERAMHERLGLAERMERAGRHSIRAFISDQPRAFFAQLPFLLVGSVADLRSPFASLLSRPRALPPPPPPAPSP